MENTLHDQAIFDLVQQDDWQSLGNLIESGQINPNRRIVIETLSGRFGLYLLPTAVANNANAAVRALLRKGANPNQRHDGDLPLTLACESKNYEAIDLLIAAGADLNLGVRTDDGDGGETALMLSAEQHDIRAVNLLLKAGAFTNSATTKRNCTPIYYATSTQPQRTRKEQMKIISTLIEQGCKLRGTELHWPVFRRDAGLVEYLLSFRCPADKTLVQGEHLGPEKGSTPLTLAVETSPFDMASSDERLSIEKRKIVELLLQTGSDPNIPNGKGQTPLALCVVGHMLEEACLPSMKGSALAFAKALLTAGANPNFKPQRSKAGSAWNIAHARGLTEFISLFAAH